MASNKRGPQLALNDSKLHGLVRIIHQMRDKQVAMAKQDFTLPDLMNLFVEQKHHAHLRYVYDLIEPTGNSNTLLVRATMQPGEAQHALGHSHFKFDWWGKHEAGFYVPSKMGGSNDKPAHLLEEQAEPALVERFRQVETDLLDIQCRFALAERVLRWLNAHSVCKTLPQIRYYWPCVVVLLSKAGYKQDALWTLPSLPSGPGRSRSQHLVRAGQTAGRRPTTASCARPHAGRRRDAAKRKHPVAYSLVYEQLQRHAVTNYLTLALQSPNALAIGGAFVRDPAERDYHVTRAAEVNRSTEPCNVTTARRIAWTASAQS